MRGNYMIPWDLIYIIVLLLLTEKEHFSSMSILFQPSSAAIDIFINLLASSYTLFIE